MFFCQFFFCYLFENQPTHSQAIKRKVKKRCKKEQHHGVV